MKRALAALLVAGALVLAACGSSETEATPLACLQDSGSYLAPLRAAPQPVLLDGSVPISDCLVRDQPSGELTTVGQALIVAATDLNARAQLRPGGKAATQLGYLVGSVEQGASNTAGIHTDLLRRIESAARLSDGGAGLGPGFERAFDAGYSAARGKG